MAGVDCNVTRRIVLCGVVEGKKASLDICMARVRPCNPIGSHQKK